MRAATSFGDWPFTVRTADAAPVAASSLTVAPWIVGNVVGSVSQIRPHAVSDCVTVEADGAVLAGAVEASIEAPGTTGVAAAPGDVASSAPLEPQPASRTSTAKIDGSGRTERFTSSS